MSIPERIKQIREELKCTQEEFANTLGVSQKTVSQWEQDRNKPQIDVLRVLRDQYNINLNWLLTGRGNMFLTPEEKQHPIPFNQKPPTLSNDDFTLIQEELSNAPKTLEVVMELIKARKGDKDAIEKLKNIISGLELVYCQNNE